MPGCELPQEEDPREHIPEALLAALGPILEQIGLLTERIREYDRKLEASLKSTTRKTELLRQLEGVGGLTALGFVLTLEDPHRFERSRSVGAYLGLCPPATSREIEILLVGARVTEGSKEAPGR